MWNNRNRNRQPLITKKKDGSYALKIIRGDGVTSASVVGSGLDYSTQGKVEPKGAIYKFKDKIRQRGQILSKLGLWGNGQN